MSAYQLWGRQSRCHLSELSILLNTSEDWLWGVMAYLDAEGLVSLDRADGTVSLTQSAARNLMTRPGETEDEVKPEVVRRSDVIVLDEHRPFNGRSS
jgi:hypothetical protein